MAGRSDLNDGLRPRRRYRRFSPLMLRIMAINLIALAMLFAGILYLNEFRDRWVDSRIESLVVQSKIIAGAIGESATLGPESTSILIAPAEQIIGRLIGPTQTRARLFSVDGGLMVDSRFMALGRSVYVVPLPPPGEQERLTNRFRSWMNKALDFMSSKPNYPPYQERPEQTAADYIEVLDALQGNSGTVIRAGTNGDVISVAVPVQRFRRVLGALLLTAQTSDIEAIVEQERLRILQTFAITIAVTVLLSFFLASTIAQPIRNLARAADDVRRGIGRARDLRRFSGRRDEIGDLSISLSAMTRALYDRIDAIETFAADVAHEIKNPLSSIRSAVETLDKTDDPKIQKKLLAIIQDDIRRLDRLISDISAASRLDAELSRAESARVDLDALADAIIATYTAVTEPGREVKIILQTDNNIPHLVSGLEDRLGQVVRNLVDNAISFSPLGGTITLELSRQGDWQVLSVCDEGPGLPPGVDDKIFERFYSERPAEEAFGKHSGLGLNISKQIIEAHGGHISAKNRTKDDDDNSVIGAEISIALPARQGDD